MTPRQTSQRSCPYNPEGRARFGFLFYPASLKFLELQRGWRTLLFGLLWE